MSKRYTIIGLSLFTILIVGAGLLWYAVFHDKNPIPRSMRKDIAFTLYYPDENKLPSSYSIDEKSFKKQEGAIVYSVTNKKAVFYISLQKKPSDNEMQAFYGTRMPLKNNLSTSVGQAAVGVLNSQTFASLPTTEDTWIIVSSALNIDQQALQQILKSFRK